MHHCKIQSKITPHEFQTQNSNPVDLLQVPQIQEIEDIPHISSMN